MPLAGNAEFFHHTVRCFQTPEGEGNAGFRFFPLGKDAEDAAQAGKGDVEHVPVCTAGIRLRAKDNLFPADFPRIAGEHGRKVESLTTESCHERAPAGENDDPPALGAVSEGFLIEFVDVTVVEMDCFRRQAFLLGIPIGLGGEADVMSRLHEERFNAEIR